MTKPLEIPGTLVTLPLRGRLRPLDGFWVPGRRRSRTLAVFVHGMHSNFYRSSFKKALMLEAPASGLDLLLFNNQGAEDGTTTERFADCLKDVDAVLAWARRKGYSRFVLIGHSTGCQKIAYYQLRRRAASVKGLVFAAPGDDLALARRDLGRRLSYWLGRARRMKTAGNGRMPLPAECKGYAAQRFLSIADPREIEADLFNFDGGFRRLRRIKGRMLAVLPDREQYACIPVKEMAARIAAALPGAGVRIVPRGDHSFRGAERPAARLILGWARNAARS